MTRDLTTLKSEEEASKPERWQREKNSLTVARFEDGGRGHQPKIAHCL